VNAAQVWFISGVGRLGMIDGCQSRFLANPPIGQVQNFLEPDFWLV